MPDRVLTQVSFLMLWHPHFSTDAPAEAIIFAVSSNSGCVKCATNYAGKRSCCARGGAWFKNCGDTGDAKFNHTWAEGIRACKGFATSFLVKPPPKVMLRHVGLIVDSQSRNETQLEATISSRRVMPSADTTDCTDCVGLTKLAVCTCGLFIILSLQTYCDKIK